MEASHEFSEGLWQTLSLEGRGIASAIEKGS